jgi:hypothetical protein
LEGLGKMEVWGIIKNYPNYEVSTKGNIRNIKTLNILKSSLRNGYPSVSLSKEGKAKTVNIHRIVASVFLGEKDLIINHKDGDKTNNSLENLEWVSYKDNAIHALENKLTKTHPNKVGQYTLKDQELIKEYSSIIEASKETGISDKHIGSVCRGNRKSTGGYVWKYIDKDFSKVNEDEVNGKEIKDFPNYIITQEGKVYSKKRKDYLIPSKIPSGYLKVKLCNNGNYKDFYIHKLVKDHF